jgi:enoyl-CoA hydratase/carnithine racemase
MYSTLLTDHAAGVTTVTLNRPEHRNAFDATMRTELVAALEALDADDAVRAIVVTGAGSTFSAGADMSGAAIPGNSGGDSTPPAPAPPFRPWELRTPIIAAINGAAVGMGLTYPMMWDIRVAAEDAKLGFVFTRRGLVPEGNASWLLQRLVGASRALELLLTGRTFSGAEAAEIGLVTRAVPADEVLATAQAIATDLAANTSPASVALTKRMFYRYMETNDRWASRVEELELFGWMARRPDAAEGVRAFLEKRPPEWPTVAADDLPDGWR